MDAFFKQQYLQYFNVRVPDEFEQIFRLMLRDEINATTNVK